MELKKYSESVRIIIVGFGHLPLFLVLQVLYYVNHPVFVDVVVFPDTLWYNFIFVSLRSGNGIPQWLHSPFKQRVLFPYITAIFYNLTYPIMHMSEEWYFFAVNSILMIGVNILLYTLFKHYTSKKLAIFGVWVHNISFPVIWYFLAGLTDTLGYLFILLGLVFLKVDGDEKDVMFVFKRDVRYFTTLVIGILVRESVLITVPIWLYIKYKQKPKDWVKAGYKTSDKVWNVLFELLPLFILLGAYFIYYGLGNKTHFHLPPANWWFVTILCLVPFVLFFVMWKMNTEDKVYSIFVVLYSVYAMFFTYYDGRFLVLGYPIWIAYTLKVMGRLGDWIRNERDLMNRSTGLLEHG